MLARPLMKSPGSLSVLSPEFYDRDPRQVARALLGKLLVRKTPRGILAGRFVETEAYLGEGDLAAHSAAGKTARNSVLFGPPGYAYVYFIYGNYYCLNVSCLPDGVAGGVLFRALEPVAGIAAMAAARGIELRNSDLREIERRESTARGESDRRESDHRGIAILQKISSGPGRLCEAFGVTRERDNGKNLASPQSDLRITDDGYRVRKVGVTKRIGITKSAEQPLRYVIAGNPFVSGPKSGN